MDSAARRPDPSLRHRLPYTVSPRRYRLHLAPDLEAETFAGDVVIEAEAHEPVRSIALHAQDLAIASAAVQADGQRLAATVEADREHDDRVVLSLSEPLRPGPVEIELAFSGKLLEQLHGFYRSTFTDDEGRSRTLAVTQFEATDARRAFPCFDEPDRKAVFSISVDVAPGLSAFSNAPVVSEQPADGGATRVTFADTIPMSTYLAALVVGPLEATEPVDVRGIGVRVVHVPGREKLTGFALEVAAHALGFFADWFGLEYPGAKLDLVAVPDFAFGAMENLGCVVFRETTLLVDPERASRLDLERVADVVSHEVAHMWFGDLVTMKWWNGIWLNEAFASFMELLSVDAFRPQWQRWVSFGTERDSAMATDALHSTRPVEYPVGPPEDAQAMFDVLTYQKGAGVLRMLERYLGADVFQAGIRRYLADHRLGNTETTDLWDALEQASGQPVRRVMDRWIFQGGFPLVTAQRHGASVTLGRQPFCYRPADGPSAIGDRWPVPVLWRVPAGTTRVAAGEAGQDDGRLLLEDETVTVAAGRGPVVVNAGGWGFYRVAYDADSLRELSARAGQLETLERYNLLSDTWAGVVAGQLELGEMLRLAEGMRHEREPEVWRPVTGVLGFLDLVSDDGRRRLLADYTRALVGPCFEALGWERREDEGERTATLRAELLRTLGTVGDDGDVQRRCLELHAAAMGGAGALDPDLAPAVVAVVARAGGAPEFEAFLAHHRRPPTPQEGVRYLQALGRFEDPALAERAFEVAVGEARSQDGPFLVATLLTNRVAGEDSWSRLEASFDELQARFPPNLVPRMVEPVQLLCRSPEVVGRVQRFLAGHPVPGGQRTVDQALERQRVNLALTGRLADGLAEELSAGIGRLSSR